jgi:hypothetical protein
VQHTQAACLLTAIATVMMHRSISRISSHCTNGIAAKKKKRMKSFWSSRL